MADTELLCYDEVKVWKIIKENPEELGFILQEDNYHKYASDFNFNEAPITEEEFYLVRNYFLKKE